MLSVTRLLTGTVGTQDALRYRQASRDTPAHMLHFAREKKPVVVWNVTQRCNLHCAHCYSDSKNRDYPDELSTEEGLGLLADLAGFGVPTVLFSGGEPLLRDDLFVLARAARELGMRTVLSSNGTLLDEATAEEAADAGFSYAGLSIDGVPERHDKLRGKPGAFRRTIGGIRAARRAGLRTGVRFTVNAINRADLAPIFELAERERVDRLCVYHLAYAGRGERMARLDLQPETTREVVEEIFDRVEDQRRRGVSMEVLTVDNPVDNVLLLKRIQATQPARAAEVEQLLRWNGGNQSGIAIACVDPRGRVHPDQFSWHIDAGDIRQRGFAEIWNDANPVLAPYRQRPRAVGGRCAECRFFALCNGGLRVRAESASADRLAPDPACYLTDEEIAA